MDQYSFMPRRSDNKYLYLPSENNNICYLCNKNSECIYSSGCNKKSIRHGTINSIRFRYFCSEYCVMIYNKHYKCHRCNCELEQGYDFKLQCFECRSMGRSIYTHKL